MGRVITPTYRVEAAVNVLGFSFFGWDCRINGRPTVKNAEKWRRATNESFQPNGVNWHVSQATGVVPHITQVRIVAQKGPRTGEVVAETKMPMFEVV